MPSTLTPTQLSTFRGLVVDVREYPEYAAGHIPNSTLVPLSTLAATAASWDHAKSIALICRTQARSNQAAQQLASLHFTNVSVLEGGITAWIAASLPVARLQRVPWSLERQVRIVAGSIVFISTLLGLLVSPWFFAATLFVGAGLTIAGLTDTCLMGSMLARLPWNQPRQP